MEEWVLPVECDVKTGDCFVTIPDNFLSIIGWKEETILVWTIHEDQTITVRSKI